MLVNTGLSLGVLVGGSSVATADPSNGRGNRKGHNNAHGDGKGLKVRNGRFEINVDPSELEEAEYRQWREVIEDFNRAIEAGRLSITNKNEDPEESAKTSEISANETTIEVHGDSAETSKEDQ